MTDFVFNPLLLKAGIRLGRLELCHLLLMNNSAVPWFILVPETDTVELCDLDSEVHKRLFHEVHHVSRMVREQFTIDKLNVATLGNIVPQMHLHVIGRKIDDYCWPGGVWGTPITEFYTAADVTQMRERVSKALGTELQPYHESTAG
jgi:diadenosine tetraphosphate (Ap4A) HIT family hydrolase